MVLFLAQPGRMIADEGVRGALHWCETSPATKIRASVITMARTFKKYDRHRGAAIVARKPK